MYVEIFFTMGSLMGMVLFYWQELFVFYEKLKMKSIAGSMENKDFKAEDLYYMPEGINQIVRRLIKITLGINYKHSSYLFMILTVAILVITYILTFRIVNTALRLILITIFSLLPLLLLVARLQKLRVRSSKEGKILVIELLDNYKIHYYNMQHAIEVTASTIEEAPNCKRLLFNLSKGINRASNNGEIKSLLDEFKYAIGTSWAGILTDNIYFALSSGFKVDIAMEDLINSISMAEEVNEKSKRENNEAGLILKYLVPVCYLLTYVGAVKVFGLTSKEFIYYQFGTTTGISWFSVVIVMYVISLLVKFFLTQTKLDL